MLKTLSVGAEAPQQPGPRAAFLALHRQKPANARTSARAAAPAAETAPIKIQGWPWAVTPNTAVSERRSCQQYVGGNNDHAQPISEAVMNWRHGAAKIGQKLVLQAGPSSESEQSFFVVSAGASSCS